MNRKLLLVFGIACSIALISWGYVGHQVVAEVAEQHTDIRVLPIIEKLLNGKKMGDVASWADEVRNQPDYKHTSPWHFLNVPIGLTYSQFIKEVHDQKQENIYTAILNQEKILSDKQATNDQKSEALKFLIHLVGDAHQPMHVSRAEDKGGNTIQVQFDGRGTNLHSLWDTRLIDKTGKSANQLAEEYDDKHLDNGAVKKLQADSLMQWLWESYQISTKLYAEVEKNNKLGEGYYNTHIPLIEERLGVAGVRLAGVLNHLLYDPSVKITSVKLLPPPPLKVQSVPHESTILIKLNDISNHIGQTIQTTGKVYSHKELGSFILINVGADYPNQLLTIVLRGDAKSVAKDIDGKVVRVTGRVIDYKGKPEIEIRDSKDFITSERL
jgi:hypothetical protein